MKLKKAAATLSSANYFGQNNETHRTGIWDTGGEGDYKPGLFKPPSGTNKSESGTTVTTSRTSKTKSEPTVTTSGTLVATYASQKTTEDTSKAVIDHIIWLCGFPDDSTIVKYIKQQGWHELSHVTGIGLADMKGFYTVVIDGITLEAKPLTKHTNMLRGFIMYYKRKCRENIFPLAEDDAKNITKAAFYAYCGSLDYHDDLASWIDETSFMKGDEIRPGIDDVVVSPSTQMLLPSVTA